jgi:hypothetical protein
MSSIAAIYRARFASVFSRLVIAELDTLDVPDGIDSLRREALLELRTERRERIDRILEVLERDLRPALRDTVTRLVLTADLLAATAAVCAWSRDRDVALEEIGAALLADL